MRPDEEFVARSLVGFFGGPSAASIEDGEDPPDFYLNLGANRVGVEVTRLSQFARDPNRTRYNRSTHDAFGLRLLDELDSTLGPSLPGNVSLFLAIRLPVRDGARFRKSLTDWLREIKAVAGTPRRKTSASRRHRDCARLHFGWRRWQRQWRRRGSWHFQWRQ